MWALADQIGAALLGSQPDHGSVKSKRIVGMHHLSLTERDRQRPRIGTTGQRQMRTCSDPSLLREDALVTATEEFIIDTTGLQRVDEVEAVRQTLDVIAKDAATIETDIPWQEARGWPDEVQVAAGRLGALLSDKDPAYQMPGIVPVNEEVWQSFRTFAPFAYGALVRRADGTLIATVDDEGTATWVRLNDAQRASLEALVGRTRVVPLNVWRHRRRPWWARWARRG